MSSLPIRDGDLFHCCIETVRQFDGRDDEGIIITCPICFRRLGVDHGTWQSKPLDRRHSFN
jgi:hypothetical protein